MPLFAESQEKIFSDVMLEIIQNTNLSRASNGAKMRALVEAVSRKMGRMWSQFDLNMGQAFIDGAEGQFLGFIGDLYGVERLGEETAKLSSLDRILKFFVDVGTFGSINGGGSILIPSGTLISTEDNASGILYRVVVSTVLSSTASEAFIAVQSVRGGSGVNVGRNRLTFHDFNGYADNVSNTLKVTNDAEIVQGQDPENNANYRFRIANQILNVEKANETAIRLTALTVPGVADVIVLPFNRGIGTYDLMIKSVSPSISQSLVDTVQSAIDNVTAKGLVSVARGPKEVGTSIVGTITTKRKITPQEESEILNAATDNVTAYINNLDIGEDFIINEVVERVMATSDLIRTIGSSSKPLDSLFIYKPSRLEDNKLRSTLVTDLSPQSDERIIVENQHAGATPILLRVAV